MFEKIQPKTLYIVGTPIGNLDDITFRAIEILKSVNAIAAEDTRHTGKLLHHFQITTPQISYHEHNKASRHQENHTLCKRGLRQSVPTANQSGRARTRQSAIQLSPLRQRHSEGY